MKLWTNILFEKEYFGKEAVGTILKSKKTGRILVLQRSKIVMDPNTFSIVISGKIDENESKKQTAMREISEELDYKGKILSFELIDVFKDKNEMKGFEGTFKFYTFLAIVPKEFKPMLNWEHTKYFWWNGEDKIKGKMHYGSKRLLRKKRKKIF